MGGGDLEPPRADDRAVTAVTIAGDDLPSTSGDLDPQTAVAVPPADDAATAEAAIPSGGDGERDEPEVPAVPDAEVAVDPGSDEMLAAGAESSAADTLTVAQVEADEEQEEEEVAVTYRPPAPDGSTFRVKDYKVSFSPDVIAGAGGFAPGIGVAGQFALGLSDVLGNHNILFSANVFGDISQSDFFLTYYNLEHRSNWGVTLFQYRNDYLSFYDNAVLRTDREVFRGAEVFLWRPFSKFRRVELGLQGAFVERNVVSSDFESGTGVAGLTNDRIFFLKPQLAFVTDTVLFGSTGPIAGARNRIGVSHSFGDLSYTTVGLDLRRYFNIRQRHTFAFRVLGTSSFGQTPQTFAIGGPWTVRGWPFESFRGTNIGVTNVEYRFPLVEQFRFGWPVPIGFRGIIGVLFFDAGTAFNRHDEWRPFADSGSFFRFDDVFASYGFGARINLGFLILRWDLAQRTDLDRRIGRPISTLTIGAAF